VFSLKPHGRPRGNVLLSYIIEGFRLRGGEPSPTDHTNYRESWQMAQTWL
jgi:hypothetical protein